MAFFPLIFVAAFASIISAAPKIYVYPDITSIEYVDPVIYPSIQPDYEIYPGGESNGHDNGNQNGLQGKICRPSEAQKNIAGMVDWCNANCFHNPPYCPESHCQCYYDIDIRTIN